MKRLLRALGFLVAAIATGYFAVSLIRSIGHIQTGELITSSTAPALVVATLLYCAIIPLSTVAWAMLMRDTGSEPRFGELLSIFLLTQLAKYVPGNIGQPVGRVALAAARGYPKGALAHTISIETVLATLAGLLVGLALLLSDREWSTATQFLSGERIAAMLAILLGLLVAIVWLMPKIVEKVWPGENGVVRSLRSVRPMTLTACFLIYVANYLVIGWGLQLVAHAVSGAALGDFAFYVGAFSLAWLAGFITPGAPAGLGVREAVLTAILGTMYSASVTITIVVLLRLTTIVGDGLMSACGALMYRRIAAAT